MDQNNPNNNFNHSLSEQEIMNQPLMQAMMESNNQMNQPATPQPVPTEQQVMEYSINQSRMNQPQMAPQQPMMQQQMQPQQQMMQQPVMGIQPVVQPQQQINQVPMQDMQMQQFPQNTQLNIDQSTVIGFDNNSIEDRELLKSYIHEDYDKFISGKFNWCAFLFTSLYLLYRKAYVPAIIVFAINTILNSNLLSIIIAFILGVTFNNFYTSEAKKRIVNIKQKNPGKTHEELKQICFLKGGGSILSLILGIGALYIFLVIIRTLLLLLVSLIGFSTGTEEPGIQNPTQTSYKGTIQYDETINIQDKISLTKPTIFTDRSTSSAYSGNTPGCGYTLASPTGYKTASNLIKQIAKYHNDNETVSNKTSNRLNWYYTTYTKSGINYYQYATEKDGKIYLLTFEHDTYSNSNCPTYKDQVLNNIK